MTVANLFLLGQFRLELAGGGVIEIRGRKARALLCFLAMSPNGQADRTVVAEKLWSEARDPKGSLRQAVREIRLAIGDRCPGLLSSDRLHLALNFELVTVDARFLLDAIAAGPDHAEEALSWIREGELFDGNALVDPVFDDWREIESRNLQQRLETGLQQLADDTMNARRFKQAEKFATALLSMNACCESAHQTKMKIASETGSVSAGLRQYQICKEVLAREIGVEPDDETEDLFRRLKELPSKSSESVGQVMETVPAMALPEGAFVFVDDFLPRDPTTDSRGLGEYVSGRVRGGLSEFEGFNVFDTSPQGGFDPTGLGNVTSRQSFLLTGWYLSIGATLRIYTQLSHLSGGGRVVWSAQFDNPRDCAFAQLDLIVDQLVQSLDFHIQSTSGRHALLNVSSESSPYDQVMRAIPTIFEIDQDSMDDAEFMLKEAIAKDPRFSRAFAWSAFLIFIKIGQGWSSDLYVDKERVEFFARRALELAPTDGFARAVAGHNYAFVGKNYVQAIDEFDQALKLNPNSAYLWGLSAITRLYLGQPKRALSHLNRYANMWPADPAPFFFGTARCFSLLAAGQHEAASRVGERVLAAKPQFNAVYRPMIATYGHLGKIEQAERLLGTLLEREPAFSVEWFRQSYLPLGHEYADHVVEGLQLAGAPKKS